MDPSPPPDSPALELPLAEELPSVAPRPVAVAPGSETTHANPLRLLASIAVGFVAMFLFLRTFAVEPFGVPTGSMAPALLGNHREAPCPRCGYPVRVGSPASVEWRKMVCPNCERIVDMSAASEVNGDRLLVDKNVFNLRSPRRWEMAVFRCPDPKDPLRPYVKRVIGLPNETIRIIDGEVYADGALLRKSLVEVRETRIPLFDMNFAPKRDGWGVRWLVDPPDADRRLPREFFSPPRSADRDVIQNHSIVLDAGESPQHERHLQYRHYHLDNETESALGIPPWNSYNGPPRKFATDVKPVPACHDFSVECTLEVAAAAGSGTFSCELYDGLDKVGCELPVGPTGAGQVNLTRRNSGGLASASGVTLKPGKSYRIEFAFVDRLVSLAVDGKEIVPAQKLPQAEKRKPVTRPLMLAARGCRVIVRDLKLNRDIYYTDDGDNGPKVPATLGPTEYFMLGDNSGNSEDARKWPRPGVPERDFIGKPFLIHQPLRVARVTLGGRDRVFQTLDWSRLRWVR